MIAKTGICQDDTNICAVNASVQHCHKGEIIDLSMPKRAVSDNASITISASSVTDSNSLDHSSSSSSPYDHSAAKKKGRWLNTLLQGRRRTRADVIVH